MPLVSSMKPKRSPRSIRWYAPNGRPCNGAGLREARKHLYLPSVTEVLSVIFKPGLDHWNNQEQILSALRLPKRDGETEDRFLQRVMAEAGRKAEAAARFGTKAHSACESINLGGPKPVPGNPMLPYMEHYHEWFLKNISHVIGCEQVLVNTEAGYAGRCDLEAYQSTGDHVVVDIKTQLVKKGKPEFYKTWAMQLAAYGKCKGINRGISLVINSEKPEPCYMKVWDNLDEHYTAFIHCLELWCYEKRYWPKKGETPCKSGN